MAAEQCNIIIVVMLHHNIINGVQSRVEHQFIGIVIVACKIDLDRHVLDKLVVSRHWAVV